MKRHLILVGLPGAGKSTVGRLVAANLQVPLQDIDTTIEAKLGITIADIFATRGEAEFRRLEQSETATALAGETAVIVPGGGWAAQPGNLESVAGRVATVYLATSVETAVRRLSAGETRPLLIASDPTAQLRDLAAARKPYYEKCDHHIWTDGKNAEQVANEVTELALESGAL